MDLGRETNNGLGAPAQAEPNKKRISYPSFNLSDETAEKFSEEYNCSVGDELTATVKLRVSSVRKDEYGHSLGFDVISLDNIQEQGDNEEEESDEPDDEEKILGYKRPAGKNETPPLADLAD